MFGLVWFCVIQSNIVGSGLQDRLTGVVTKVHSQLNTQSPHKKLQFFSQSTKLRCGPNEFGGVTFGG